MRYRITILTVIMALSAMTSTVWGDNVDLKRARHTAATYMSALTGRKANPDEARLVYQIPNSLQPNVNACYVFNIPNQGFIIVAGSDSWDPIIAYNEFDTIDMNNLSPATMWWINGVSSAISEVQNENLASPADVAQAWKEIDNEILPLMNTKEDIVLMTEHWNQTGPNDWTPTYNKRCPDSAGYYCPVGCGATALAQIMHYWRYPRTGSGRKWFPWPSWNASGRHTTNTEIKYKDAVYDYDLMPDQLFINSPIEQIDTTAFFCMHVGTALNMDYELGGSGSVVNEVPTALGRYFKYKSTAKVKDRYYYNGQTVTDDDTWCDMIKNEIENKRPVFYRGTDADPQSGADAAHAFVCYGYVPQMTPTFFYFNWGWGNSGDGKYNMRNKHGLKPRQSAYDFYYSQGAVIGIEPPDDSNRFVGITTPTETPTQLMPAFPNPAHNSIILPYKLNGNTHAEMQIMDVTGKVIERIKVHPGQHEVTLNVSRYAKGIYVYRLNGLSRKFLVN